MIKRLSYMILATILLVACSGKDRDLKTFNQADHYIYPIDNPLTNYYVAEDGTLYCTEEIEAEDISALCSYMLQVNNSFLWEDRFVYPEGQIYDDLYSVYQNGHVVFNIPSELYLNDFERYLSDDMSKEDYVKESLRRIDIYLKE